MSKTAIVKTLNKTALKLKKYAPTILVGVGVVGTVASTVLACKATTKLEGVLEQTKGDVDIIHTAAARANKELLRSLQVTALRIYGKSFV